ncbi:MULTISPECIES: hypothetical protein [Haloarcula]|uniref:hypothetical protein n=1 Tax=Haloarcula TaxID=2237 RepID=UPI0023E8B81A|nr:hypothetical protein [Halomicroarcula sp. SHR3]
MGVVDIEADTLESDCGYQPVIWFDCPGCGKRMKSTWLLWEDDGSCSTCNTEFRFEVIGHLDVLYNQHAVWAADQDINRSGDLPIPCQGCDETLNLGWFTHNTDYSCSNCETHHHLEIVFDRIGNGVDTQDELCLLCEETSPIARMENHHISYEPEKVVRVCRRCHKRIHKEDGYHDELDPETIPDGSVGDLVTHPS